MHDVVIIGSGPAGYTAAIYTSRANLSTVLLAGNQPGGQPTITTEVENYPGFPKGIMGPELMTLMQEQAERFGAKVVYDEATEVDFSGYPFHIMTYDKKFEAKAVIIATGASPRKLGVKGETEYAARGVSYCATCDGFFFKDVPIAVIGGGDSAVEEAIFLTRYASTVYLIHRRNRLRASSILQDRIMRTGKIKFVWNSVVDEIVGETDKGVTALRLKDVESDKLSVLPIQGVFIAIGHVPNTEIFKGQIEMDELGYIITDRRQHSSVKGVFAAGDVQDRIYKQAVVAAGAGCAAALEAEKFIAELENRTYPGGVL